MTNLVSKSSLLDRIGALLDGLELFDATAELLEKMGSEELKGRQTGARTVLAALRQGLLTGAYDAPLEEIGAEVGLSLYEEGTEDTEDMDDLAPEEESLQSFDGCGIIVLDPATSPAELAELTEFYSERGFLVRTNH